MKVIIYFLYIIVICLFHDIIFPWFIYILTSKLLVFPFVCLFVCLLDINVLNIHTTCTCTPEKDTVTIAFLWIWNNFSEQLLNWLIFQLFRLFRKINRQDVRYVSFTYLLCNTWSREKINSCDCFRVFLFPNQINRKKIDHLRYSEKF